MYQKIGSICALDQTVEHSIHLSSVACKALRSVSVCNVSREFHVRNFALIAGHGKAAECYYFLSCSPCIQPRFDPVSPRYRISFLGTIATQADTAPMTGKGNKIVCLMHILSATSHPSSDRQEWRLIWPSCTFARNLNRQHAKRRKTHRPMVLSRAVRASCCATTFFRPAIH